MNITPRLTMAPLVATDATAAVTTLPCLLADLCRGAMTDSETGTLGPIESRGEYDS